MHWAVLILISAFLLAIYNLMLKHELKHETNTQIIALYPLVTALIVLVFMPVDFGIMLSSTGWLLLLKSGTLALALFCSTLALKHLPISIYAPMKNLTPLFLLILSWLLLNESVGPLQIFGLLLIVLGSMLLDIDVRQGHQVQQIKRFLKQPAILLLILAAIAVSFCPILDRLILRTTDIYTTLFWYCTLMAAIFWIVYGIQERKMPFAGLSPREGLWIALTGVVIFLADIIYFTVVAMPGIILVVIIGVRRLSNLFTTLLGGTLLHEDHILYKGAMCLLMIAGTVLLVI